MNEWWTSLQKLSEFNTALRAIGFFTTLIAAFSAFGIWRVGARIQFLQGLENVKTQERIATANNNAQQAIFGQKTLDTKLAESVLQTERLKQENLKLSIKYEEERTARLKIEERLADRIITKEQAAKLKTDLKLLIGKKVIVAFVSGVPETATFATALVARLKEAGMIVDAPQPMLLLGHVAPGIAMVIGNSRLAEANILANALSDAGLVAKPVPAQKDDNNAETLQLTVGPKN